MVPLGAVLYIGWRMLMLIQSFWLPVLSFFNIALVELWPWSALLSVIATLFLFWLAGRLLEMAFVGKIFSFLVPRFPILSYIWSGEEKESVEGAGPVLFCNPINGEWKLGFVTGMQKTTDGREFNRVFYFTGIGDHVFIEKDQEQKLIIRLGNPPQDLARLISSFMISGPEYLIVKDKPKEPAKNP